MKLTADQKAYLDGLLDDQDEDTSLEAWQQECEDRIVGCGLFRENDPADVLFSWMRAHMDSWK